MIINWWSYVTMYNKNHISNYKNIERCGLCIDRIWCTFIKLWHHKESLISRIPKICRPALRSFSAWGVVHDWAASWQNQQNDTAPRENSSLIRVFAVCLKKAWVLSYPLSAQWRLWSDWTDAQADLSLHWAHMPFCWVLSWGGCYF